MRLQLYYIAAGAPAQPLWIAGRLSMFYKIDPSRKPRQFISRQLCITLSLGDSAPDKPDLTDEQIIEFVQDIRTTISIRHEVTIAWQRCSANTMRIEITFSPEDERSRWLVWQLRRYLQFSTNLDLLALENP